MVSSATYSKQGVCVGMMGSSLLFRTIHEVLIEYSMSLTDQIKVGHLIGRDFESDRRRSYIYIAHRAI